MKTSVWVILTMTILLVGSTLAVMNNACKRGSHAWCAPMSSVPNHLIRPSPRA
jgi:hypothetical protein